MAQFIVFTTEGEDSEGIRTDWFINVEQICKVVTASPRGAVESAEVYMSDGNKVLLQGQSAVDLVTLLTRSENSLDVEERGSKEGNRE